MSIEYQQKKNLNKKALPPRKNTYGTEEKYYSQLYYLFHRNYSKLD